MGLDNCLKFRHFIYLRTSLLLLLLSSLYSCGKEYTHSTSSLTSGLNLLLLEKQCFSSSPIIEPITRDIQETYFAFERSHPFLLLTIPERYYDFKNPLVLNLKSMENSLLKIKSELDETKQDGTKLSEVAKELYYLHQNSQRFEVQKCAFGNLAKKKIQDITPFLKLEDFCIQRNKTNNCTEKDLTNLSLGESQFVQEQMMKMCQALGNSKFLCQEEIGLSRNRRNLETMALKLLKRFKDERFNKLFSLASSHLKFSCVKKSQFIEMNLKVRFDPRLLVNRRALINHVIETWSSDKFKLNLILEQERNNEEVISVQASPNSLSYVLESDNRQIFLNSELRFEEQKRILSHEFGHVLGFPDCYTEFYDHQKRALVYFEMGKDNFNLMCSVKKGAAVPREYLEQLALKSCLF